MTAFELAESAALLWWRTEPLVLVSQLERNCCCEEWREADVLSAELRQAPPSAARQCHLPFPSSVAPEEGGKAIDNECVASAA